MHFVIKRNSDRRCFGRRLSNIWLNWLEVLQSLRNWDSAACVTLIKRVNKQTLAGKSKATVSYTTFYDSCYNFPSDVGNANRRKLKPVTGYGAFSQHWNCWVHAFSSMAVKMSILRTLWLASICTVILTPISLKRNTAFKSPTYLSETKETYRSLCPSPSYERIISLGYGAVLIWIATSFNNKLQMKI